MPESEHPWAAAEMRKFLDDGVRLARVANRRAIIIAGESGPLLCLAGTAAETCYFFPGMMYAVRGIQKIFFKPDHVCLPDSKTFGLTATASCSTLDGDKFVPRRY
jgi:hypothetical protein